LPYITLIIFSIIFSWLNLFCVRNKFLIQITTKWYLTYKQVVGDMLSFMHMTFNDYNDLFYQYYDNLNLNWAIFKCHLIFSRRFLHYILSTHFLLWNFDWKLLKKLQRSFIVYH
jgi:hypothetical protein